MLNQHYLNNMFTLDPNERDLNKMRVLESNPFMDSEVDIIDSTHAAESGAKKHSATKRPVKELSRLWKYRNGGIPED